MTFRRIAAGPRPGALWDMACFDGLSEEQQRRLVHHGNLPMGYRPEGTCPNGAEVEIVTMWDLNPGPRMYCLRCAIQYLTSAKETWRVMG
jgi:hypothetical protein